MNELTKNAKEIGLEVNLKKTESMSTDKLKLPLNLTIYDKPIKQVTEFVYLGHKLTSSSNHEATNVHQLVCLRYVSRVWLRAKGVEGNPKEDGEIIYYPGQTPKTGVVSITLSWLAKNGAYLAICY